MAQSVTADRSAPSPFRGVVLRRELFERLSAAGRVTEVSAPPGSGKTYLLRSGIRDAGLADRAAWVSVGRDERDPGRFWIATERPARHEGRLDARPRRNPRRPIPIPGRSSRGPARTRTRGRTPLRPLRGREVRNACDAT